MEGIVLLALSYAFPGLVKLVKKSVQFDDLKFDKDSIKASVTKVKTKLEPRYQNRVTNKFEGFHFKKKKPFEELSEKRLDDVRPNVEEVIAQMELEEAGLNKEVIADMAEVKANESSGKNHNVEKFIRDDFRSKKNIRRAIIMSEVLGKPKSLKS